ncbi:MAG: hypothetical protein JWM34_1500 [Ilumatobacteraceae bacterium]|nr:hypothetical protein [Ilumatobacteraceae bacterium]
MNASEWESISATFIDRLGAGDGASYCSVCMQLLGVSGAGVTLMGGDQTGPLCVAGDGAAALEDLQFTLGEGPCHDAFRSGLPAIVTRLDADAPAAWLPFAELAVRIGVGAVFAYPLSCDGVRLGVLTLYERDAGDLSDVQHVRCLAVADVLAARIASTTNVGPDGDLIGMIDEAFEFRAEIHQASGMVASQLSITPVEALIRIRAHAYAAARPVADIAADVVDRRLRLEDDRYQPLPEDVEP